MTVVEFTSEFEELPGNIPFFTNDEIKKEPMFFRAEYDFVMKHGGPITKAFYQNIPYPVEDALFDSRVHMLFPGFYPSIPGWHHDSVERTAETGQPNYLDASCRPYHVMALVSERQVSETEFVLGNFQLTLPAPGLKVYEAWDKYINEQIKAGLPLPTRQVNPNRFYWFDDRALHRAMPATARGFRWFGRLTYDSPMKPQNEIRTQTQEYLTDPSIGW